MLIQIHMIQNHSPANLNRDDLGAPKTCYFGGVLRSRISSQCLKRSIRTSEQFKQLLGAVRTRRLAQLVAFHATAPKSETTKPTTEQLLAASESPEFKTATDALLLCGIAPKDKKKPSSDDADHPESDDKSAGLVYVTNEAVRQMSALIKGAPKSDTKLARKFAEIIATQTQAPDMALCGRMLEPKKGNAKDGGDAKEKKVWGKDPTVEAALQVAHAISTHVAWPEVDYYVAADDLPGEDAGAGFVDEAMFASACFYKYFSINWETLLKNLHGDETLAAHTAGAFIIAAARTNPTGKQNSFAAHNPPDGIMIELRPAPISYANAFANPTTEGERDLISQSIAQLGQYVHDIDTGYGRPTKRLWFSPNLRHPLTASEKQENGKEKLRELSLPDSNCKSLDELIRAVVSELRLDWDEVRKATLAPEIA